MNLNLHLPHLPSFLQIFKNVIWSVFVHGFVALGGRGMPGHQARLGRGCCGLADPARDSVVTSRVHAGAPPAPSPSSFLSESKPSFSVDTTKEHLSFLPYGLSLLSLKKKPVRGQTPFCSLMKPNCQDGDKA